MTRAMDGLFLSDSEGRSNDGLFKHPSRFIFEAGADNVEYVKDLDSSLMENTKKYIEADERKLKESIPAFAAGDRVRHPVFGEGTVTAADAAALCYSVRFDALATDRSIRFGAQLEKA
ncbi:hypothetical protein SDC9_210766 [bioreactor metagenome]|uniref:Uncharacterized protein n=1 Tax=bioreactor metagenome TaxID=1076179 RepID=A0A645JIG8_9ZZZZ